MNRIFLLVSLCAILLPGCKGTPKEKNVTSLPVPQLTDSSYLFDGKTLNGWEISDFGTQGPVSVSGGSIILGMGDGCTGVTYKRSVPVADYEISLDAKKVSGNDFFCGITFPCGKDPCSLIIGGWGGSVVGLSCINGADASENETTRNMSFEKERWYHIRLKVTNDSIIAWIDSAKAVAYAKKGKKLSIRPEVDLSRPFGIASWKTTAALKNIRMEVKK